MTATERIDPTKAVGRLLPEGWRVERTFAYDGGTALFGVNWYGVAGLLKRVPHGETVDCIIEAPLYGLTIQQPYASLIAHGIKTIETRGFQPRVVKPGGDLAIIAGDKTLPPGEYVGNYCYWLGDICEAGDGHLYPAPRSAVVAVARFVEALPIVAEPPANDQRPALLVADFGGAPDLTIWHTEAEVWPYPHPPAPSHYHHIPDQLPYGDYRPGRYGWLLDNIRRLPEPIPCTGFQGLRALPADVDAATRQAVQ